ncbi:hypothetical protein HAX54_040745 [Datura stramonium]|uniref:Uncharacterized protein n=1 Tax=Datura stramonium TaxID=4076 RepID=A0ABS8VQQ1_DATST|nr:hypothetical protein [Datura stramonium]
MVQCHARVTSRVRQQQDRHYKTCNVQQQWRMARREAPRFPARWQVRHGLILAHGQARRGLSPTRWQARGTAFSMQWHTRRGTGLGIGRRRHRKDEDEVLAMIFEKIHELSAVRVNVHL